MRKISFEIDAFNEFISWQQLDKKIYLKLTELIKEVIRTPYEGKGKPELLKYNFRGFWSREITKGHRLIYEVTNDSIRIISCKYHYII